MTIPAETVERSRLHTIDEVKEYLLISGYAAVTEQNIVKWGVTLVVDATNIPVRQKDSRVQLLKVQVDDSEFAKLNLSFDEVADAIHKHRGDGGKALVHCAAGVSRSAALCMVYLMKYERLSLADSYGVVRDKRPMIAPNNGFWRQMIEFELALFGANSVKMLKVGNTHREVPDVYLADVRKAKEDVAAVKTKLKEELAKAKATQQRLADMRSDMKT